MTIKPAGKIAIVLVLVVGGFFLLKPLILNKEYKDKIQTKDSVVNVVDTPTVTAPVLNLDTPPKSLRGAPVKKVEVKKPETKRKEEVKKKKKERENLDIEF